jgi:hypothetical protein
MMMMRMNPCPLASPADLGKREKTHDTQDTVKVRMGERG